VAGFIGSPPMNFIDAELVKQKNRYAIKSDSFTILLSPDKNKQVSSYEGKRITFGFRPEDLIDESVVKDKEGKLIRARVEVIEPLGSEIYLHLSSGKDFFMARVPHHYKTELGKEVGLVIDLDKTHVFDIETENAVF
jgi:multiple sugar transport system ATP-binding protein